MNEGRFLGSFLLPLLQGLGCQRVRGVQVFDNRDSLLRTLRDNETVVAQVEIAIGILFFIIWMFTTAAIFNGEAVQQTWTALSAGLLSFSFIFGNSIREVRCAGKMCLCCIATPKNRPGKSVCCDACVLCNQTDRQTSEKAGSC